MVAAVILLGAEICAFIAWFAILITGRFPEGMFNFVVIGFRWSLRAGTYLYWMTEPHPPFVWA